MITIKVVSDTGVALVGLYEGETYKVNGMVQYMTIQSVTNPTNTWCRCDNDSFTKGSYSDCESKQ